MSPLPWHEFIFATWQTLYMVGISSAIAIVLGVPVGVLLLITRDDSIAKQPYVQKILAAAVNIGRSIPFIILLVAVIPITRMIVGTSIGTSAAIIPLTIGAIPLMARLAENALNEVPRGLTEAGLAMGASTQQIIRRILIPEALPGLVNAATVTMITLVSYSAMAGAVGGGGLGDLAIRYGYQRFDLPVMLVTIVILILIVQLLESIRDQVVKKNSRE